MAFTGGEKCFAKVKGFPPWPARINVLPPDVKVPKGKYPIFFYGTYEVCFLPSNAIFPYEKFKNKYGTPRSTLGFNKGLEELENNSTILQYGSDPEALTFLNQFYDFTVPKRSKQQKSSCDTLKEDKQDSLGSDLISESSLSNQEKSPVNNDSMSPQESEFKDIKNASKDPNELSKSDSLEELVQIDERDTVTNNLVADNADISSVPKTENVVRKCHIDEYANDFTNLLLEIRKYSWSKTRRTHMNQNKRKNRTDSRVRLFYPWYDSMKKK